ncbi:MAG: hypothetical protein AB8G17_10705 [Gammaproteobacteria bacterium]
MAASHSFHSPVTRAWAAVLALLLLWPTWTAVSNGLSDVHARPAIDYLEEKRFDDYVISEDEWLAIEGRVLQAHVLMPSNPRYLGALGWLHQLRLTLFAEQMTAAQMDAHATAARDYYQQAAALRPTWSHYWGNLALEHHRSGNYASNPYSLALTNAADFGPWDNKTQRLVTDLGTESWDYLSPRAQAHVLTNVERALHRQPQNTVRTVRALDGWTKLCSAADTLLAQERPHLLALCVQLEGTAGR